MSRFRISKDGQEIKICGNWYTEAEFTGAIKIYETAKRLLQEKGSK